MAIDPREKVGRNDPCPCGSGKKYKKCHGRATEPRPLSATKTDIDSYSTLEQHSRRGKLLTPPLAQIPKLNPISWMNHRLPEMLWAVLLVGHLPREQALGSFRQLANYIFSLPESDRFGQVTHSCLALLPRTRLAAVVDVISSQKEHSEVLRPLLLLKDLPAAGTWREVLGGSPSSSSWELLAHAVARTLFHQSQESTDCRWARVIAKMAAGELILPDEDARELADYPRRGDMRKVRPSIRATEATLSSAPDQSPGEWPTLFWNQCLRETPCFPLGAEVPNARPLAGTTVDRVREVYQGLRKHCAETTETTAVDARHDAVFGLALYCLALAEQLLRVGNCHMVTARTALRTVVECYVTLAYLVKKNNQELWKSYRAFGAGQAKLAFLKLSRTDDQTASVDLNTLESLANEDTWQEFLQIKLGDWESADLRKRSEEAGVKAIYDRFYSWASAYTHGHWYAVRDSVFDTCGNPLHRLHRVPRDLPRTLPDVIPDACEIVDKILALVSEAYPTFSPRITIN